METVKRKDGIVRYRESYYVGNKKTRSPWFTRKTDAKTWKNRLETEKLSMLAQGEYYLNRRDVNFREYAEEWLHSHVKTNCTPKTFSSYDSILRTHLYPRFAMLNLNQLTEKLGMELMNSLKVTHKASVIKNIWIVIRAVINKARREKLMMFNPFENIKKPKPDLRKDNFWVKSEINQFLLANRSDQLYPFFFVAIHTGLRLGELCGLKWDRVDFSAGQYGQIEVTRTRDKYGLKETTKTGLSRYIPITEETRMLLLNLFKKRADNSYVFLESDGSEVKYAHIYRRLHKAQEKAGSKKITVHDLRHTFASNFMMNGGDIFELKDLLGHTDIKMTMRYAHLSRKHLQKSIRFMDMVNEQNTNVPVLDPRESNREENLLMLGS
ncbi:MAG: site-specific integrase [Bacteriovorax sp.]|jgi:integrase